MLKRSDPNYVLTRCQWEELWGQLEANHQLPLGEYVQSCAKTKCQWLTDYPSLSVELISNGRYVAYVERFLQRRNLQLPTPVLESITPADMPDSYFFPLLRKQLAAHKS